MGWGVNDPTCTREVAGYAMPALLDFHWEKSMLHESHLRLTRETYSGICVLP